MNKLSKPKVVSKKLLIPIFFILIISIKKEQYKSQNYFNMYILLFFLASFIIFWFLNFPLYRFGSGYIYAFICIAIVLSFKNFNKIF